MISILRQWEKNTNTIIHIFGARAIFLLFYDNQDTESESRGIEIGVSGPIFTHKISKYLGDIDTNTPSDGSKRL